MRKPSLIMLATAAMAVSTSAQAQSVADFYKNKPLSVIVGSSPSGGYDTYARILAQFIKKYIPGNPATIVRNMPGAGSKRAINYLYNISPRDGSEIAGFFSQAAMEPILLGDASTGTKFDPLKFSWIGSIDQFTPIGIAWHTTGIRSIEDIKTKPLIVGTSGGGLTDSIYSRLLNGMIGTKFVQIAGYKGSTETAMAMERGEIPGYVGWYWAGMKRTKPHWIEKKLVTVFMQFGIDKNPEIPEVPWIFDVLKNPDDRQIFRLILSNLALARPYAGPPGIPGDRLAALRTAFEATMKDKDFLAAVKKSGNNVRPYSGQQIDTLLAEVAKTPPALIKRVQKVVKE